MKWKIVLNVYWSNSTKDFSPVKMYKQLKTNITVIFKISFLVHIYIAIFSVESIGTCSEFLIQEAYIFIFNTQYYCTVSKIITKSYSIS